MTITRTISFTIHYAYSIGFYELRNAETVHAHAFSHFVGGDKH